MEDILCRKATIHEFKKLWNYSKSNTYNYFLNLLKSKTIEFWTIELNNNLIGELYIFWDSIDKEEANGINRAYLCAFRINKEYQNKGYGSLLMNTVINHIYKKGYTEITIGIDNSEYNKLFKLYNKFGFTQLLKQTNIDLHYLDQYNNPTTYQEPYNIYIKKRYT